jgi:pyrroloquinoline quinone biosynthesis protein B
MKNWIITLLITVSACTLSAQTQLVVLGVAQDAGYPQAGCNKTCCTQAKHSNYTACLALVIDQEYWLFDATPDIKEQMKLLADTLDWGKQVMPSGIFLTHAHIGHYTGLMHFGREVMGTQGLLVYTMPRMAEFISSNGPWSQLVELKNISLTVKEENNEIPLNNSAKITPLLVPHRDEYSETVGFLMEVNEKRILFIPDIDKWEKWETNINDIIQEVDYAFLDGTFFNGEELPGRDMSEIPHPFVEESMTRFEDLPKSERKKIHFIHFNHTNPLLWNKEVVEKVEKMGFKVARTGMRIKL